MIKIDGIETEVAEHREEFGIMWSDGEESWRFGREEARDIAWCAEGATLIRRHIFVSVAEVAE